MSPWEITEIHYQMGDLIVHIRDINDMGTVYRLTLNPHTLGELVMDKAVQFEEQDDPEYTG